jgi:subtilisin family serine protease
LFLVGLVAVFTAGCGDEVGSSLTGPVSPQRMDTDTGVRAGEPVPGQYIVVLRRDAPLEDVLSASRVTRLLHTYRHALNGFAAVLTDEEVSALRAHPAVAYIEQDQIVTASGRLEFQPAVPIDGSGNGNGKGGGKPGGGGTTQPAQVLPTGVNRVDADLSATAKINGADEAVDADIAVIDTGIDLKHPDLRVVNNKTFVPGTKNGNDDNGHGSHVAGTAAAIDNGIGVVGVAPGARLWAVKVLDRKGSGFLSAVIAGVDYVTANAAQVDVANMSLSGGNSQALNDAIKASSDAGVVYVAAAGNRAADAGDSSPANSPDALTVSAIADSDGACGGKGVPTNYGADDTFATFSNYGSVVDIAAPGVDILSTYKGGAYAIGSGTSMAAPHVAGIAALYIAVNGRSSGAAAIRDAVVSAASPQSGSCGFSGDPDSYAEPAANAASF